MRATLEMQMTDKYIAKESEKQDQMSTGQAKIMDDMRNDHMVWTIAKGYLICVDEREGDNEKVADSGRTQEALWESQNREDIGIV